MSLINSTLLPSTVFAAVVVVVVVVVVVCVCSSVSIYTPHGMPKLQTNIGICRTPFAKPIYFFFSYACIIC